MSVDAISDQWEILLFALILGATHVISPRIFGFRNAQTQAFGGGLSVAYVFLHLIPSLDASDDVVGPRVYFVALLGFVVFYGLDVLFQPPKDTPPDQVSCVSVGVFPLRWAPGFHARPWASADAPPNPGLRPFAGARCPRHRSKPANGVRGALRQVGTLGPACRRGCRLCPEPRSASGSPGDRYPHRCARRLHDVSHIQRAVPGSPKQKTSRIRGRASHLFGGCTCCWAPWTEPPFFSLLLRNLLFV